AAEQPVFDPERDRSNRQSTAFGEIVQLVTADARDAAVRSHPEIAVVVFENLKDAVVMETLAPRVARQPIAGEAIQTAVVGADPDHAVGVLMDRADPAADEPVALLVSDESPAGETGDSPERADPERARTILVQRGDPIVRQAVANGVAGQPTGGDSYEPVVGAEPQRPVPLLMNRRHNAAERPLRLAVRCETPVLEKAKAAVGADPETSGMIVADRSDLSRRQADAVERKTPVLVPIQAARADPHRAPAIGEYRIHRIRGESFFLRIGAEREIAQAMQPAAIGAEPDRPFAVLEQHEEAQLGDQFAGAVSNAIDPVVQIAEPDVAASVRVEAADSLPRQTVLERMAVDSPVGNLEHAVCVR